MRSQALTIVSIDGRPICTDEVQIFKGDPEGIVDGAVVVGTRWFRIQDGILDLLPDDLADWHRRSAFARRYGLPDLNPEPQSSDTSGGGQKLEQIDFFREDSKVYDDQVSNRSFYVASDRMFLHKWIRSLKPGSLVCDLGGGSGRQAIPLAKHGVEVMSLDISEEMLHLSRARAMREGMQARITYVLADAEFLPFAPAVFDACVCYGALHHFNNPLTVMKAAAQCLREGGLWLSYDPHKSSVRFLFDWAMRLLPLYQEVARESPLFSREQMMRWCDEAHFTVEIRRHFFLPPHLLTPLSPAIGHSLLRATDAVFNVAGLGGLGGVIVVRGWKNLGEPALQPVKS